MNSDDFQLQGHLKCKNKKWKINYGYEVKRLRKNFKIKKILKLIIIIYIFFILDQKILIFVFNKMKIV